VRERAFRNSPSLWDVDLDDDETAVNDGLHEGMGQGCIESTGVRAPVGAEDDGDPLIVPRRHAAGFFEGVHGPSLHSGGTGDIAAGMSRGTLTIERCVV
jgi:hypothetical protein